MRVSTYGGCGLLFVALHGRECRGTVVSCNEKPLLNGCSFFRLSFTISWWYSTGRATYLCIRILWQVFAA